MWKWAGKMCKRVEENVEMGSKIRKRAEKIVDNFLLTLLGRFIQFTLKNLKIVNILINHLCKTSLDHASHI